MPFLLFLFYQSRSKQRWLHRMRVWKALRAPKGTRGIGELVRREKVAKYRELNSGPCAYRTSTLPLSYTNNPIVKSSELQPSQWTWVFFSVLVKNLDLSRVVVLHLISGWHLFWLILVIVNKKSVYCKYIQKENSKGSILKHFWNSVLLPREAGNW